MKRLRIREIIDSFAHNYVPRSVRSAFASWLTDRDEREEKEEALEEMWDEMCLDRERYDFSGALPSATRVLEDAKTVEKPSEGAKLKLYRRLSIISCATACIVAVVCAALLLSGVNSSTTILAASDTKSHFTLPDGTSVCLNKESTLSYRNGLNGRSRKVSLRGEAFFDVEKDPSRPFVVSTGNMDVRVLGTRFTLSAREDSPESVYLESGKVTVEGERFSPVQLNPGEAFTFDPLGGESGKRTENVWNHLAWTCDKLEFSNVSLADIVTNLEHWYNVKIDISPKVKDIRLTLTVRQEPLAEILEAISRISAVEYSINGREIKLR